MAGKNLENTLDILGSGLNLAGKVLFGLDSDVNIGEPLQIVGAHMRQKRQTGSLIDTLQSLGQQVPEMQPLLQGAQQVAQSGGVLKNILPGTSPDQPATSQGTLLGTLQGVPQSSLTSQAAVPSPQAQGQQPPQIQFSQTGVTPNTPTTQISSLLGLEKSKPDYGSPEFLSRLAKDNPELASKILLQQGGQRQPDQLETISKVLGILNYRTPEQKEAADVQTFGQKQAISDKYQEERKREGLQLQQAQLKPGEIDRMRLVNNSITTFKALPETIPKLSGPQALLGKIPGVGAPALSYLNSDLAQINKTITAANATLAFGDGGKNLTGIEYKLTFGTLPNLLENPQFYPQVKALTESRLRLKQLSDQKELFDAGRRGDQLDSQAIADFGRWRQILDKYGARAFQDPGFAEQSKKLGLSGLTTQFPQK